MINPDYFEDGKKEYDCQCKYCREHICIVNSSNSKCLDPLCENNEGHELERVKKAKVNMEIAIENYVQEIISFYTRQKK